MNRAFVAACGFAAGVLNAAALAQTSADLVNDQRTPGDVLTYGMGYNHQRYSPLSQIHRAT